MSPEGRVKNEVKRVLMIHKPFVTWSMPATGGYGASGMADFIVCAWGKFLAIECKAGYNRPTGLQYKYADDVVAAGGTHLVIDETNISSLAMLLAAWKGRYGSDSGATTGRIISATIDIDRHAVRKGQDASGGVLQCEEPRVRKR